MIPEDQNSNQEILFKYLLENSNKINKKSVILLDADRTICEEDTSRILNDLGNIDLKRIKMGFQKHGYTYDGFYLNAKIYSEMEVKKYKELSKIVASQTILYPGVVDFISDVQRIADVIIVTAGIKEIWKNIIKERKLVDVVLIGGIHDQCDDFIIGRHEKGIVCDFFKNMGKKVVAFGDSDVDTLMLQKADKAIVVVNHKNNWDLIPNLKNHKSLYQISFKDFTHSGLNQIRFEDIIKEIFVSKVSE